MVYKTCCIAHTIFTGNGNVIYKKICNGRIVIKSKCSEGDHSKTRFVNSIPTSKELKGQGIGDIFGPKGTGVKIQN